MLAGELQSEHDVLAEKAAEIVRNAALLSAEQRRQILGVIPVMSSDLLRYALTLDQEAVEMLKSLTAFKLAPSSSRPSSGADEASLEQSARMNFYINCRRLSDPSFNLAEAFPNTQVGFVADDASSIAFVDRHTHKAMLAVPPVSWDIAKEVVLAVLPPALRMKESLRPGIQASHVQLMTQVSMLLCQLEQQWQCYVTEEPLSEQFVLVDHQASGIKTLEYEEEPATPPQTTGFAPGQVQLVVSRPGRQGLIIAGVILLEDPRGHVLHARLQRAMRELVAAWVNNAAQEEHRMVWAVLSDGLGIMKIEYNGTATVVEKSVEKSVDRDKIKGKFSCTPGAQLWDFRLRPCSDTTTALSILLSAVWGEEAMQQDVAVVRTRLQSRVSVGDQQTDKFLRDAKYFWDRQQKKKQQEEKEEEERRSKRRRIETGQHVAGAGGSGQHPGTSA